jgi:predicted transcriptional regulator
MLEVSPRKSSKGSKSLASIMSRDEEIESIIDEVADRPEKEFTSYEEEPRECSDDEDWG